MKKYLLSCSLFLAAIGFSSAQITITLSDLGSTGAMFTYLHDNSTTGITVGPSGANQTWDFSALVVDDLENIVFSAPASTSSGFLFQNSNLAIELAEDTNFYIVSTNDLSVDGVTGDVLDLGTNLQANYNDNQVVMQFPSNFNDSFLDTALLDTIVEDNFSPLQMTTDSGRVKRIIETNSTIDAWGTIVTSSGTYDVLRQYIHVTYTDSVWLRFIGQTQFTFFIENIAHTYHYRWWANGEDFPVVEMETDAPNGAVIANSFKLGGGLVANLISEVDASCNGGCDGAISVEGLSGSGNYTYLWDANANGQTTAIATGLCAGTYSVTISDGISDEVISGTIGEPGAIDIPKGFGNIFSSGFDGEITPIVQGGTPPYSYNWTGPNGFNSNDAAPDGLEPGEYFLTVTDDNGCTGTQEWTIIHTGINDPVLAANITLYPNPTQGQLNLQTGTDLQLDGIKILNVLGQPMLSVTGRTSTIDVSGLSPGIYFLEATADDRKAVFRFQVIR